MVERSKTSKNRNRVFISEIAIILAGGAIALPFVIYYILINTRLTPGESHHLTLIPFLIVPAIILIGLFLLRKLTEPIDKFLLLDETKREIEEDILIRAHIRALNMPLLVTITLLTVVIVGILLGTIYMILAAGSDVSTAFNMFFSALLGLIPLSFYVLFISESKSRQILRRIVLKRKGDTSLPPHKVMKFNLQIRLLSIFLVIVLFPMVNLGILSRYRAEEVLLRTTEDLLSSATFQLGQGINLLGRYINNEEELLKIVQSQWEDMYRVEKKIPFLINERGDMILSSEPTIAEQLWKALQNEWESAIKRSPDKSLNLKVASEGSRLLEIRNLNYIVGWTKLPNKGWIVLQAQPLFYLHKQLKLLVRRITMIVVISLVAIFFIAIFFARSVTLPISQVVSILKDIAQGEGDLTRHLNIQTNNEISLLSTWFNKFVDSILRIVSQVRDASLNVTSSAQELSLVAEDINAGTEEISAATEEVTSGAEVQNKRVMETSRTLEEMGELMAEVRRQAERLGEASRRADEVAKAGGEAVGEMVAKMDRIREVTDRSSYIVERLGERSQQIGKIVSIITELARRTDMLALNAAIEASKAGDYGRGFAVVAEEVRSLADSSGSSALQIRKIVSHIQEETEEVISSMKRGVVEVEEGREVVAKTGEALQQIVDMVREMATMIEQIRASVQGQVQSAQRVVKAIDEVSVIAEENASSASQVSATIEEQVRLTERMVAFSEGMEQMSDNLRKLVSTFKLNRLGVAFQSFSNPFFLSMKDSIEDTAPKLGVKVTISNAEYDLSQQLRAIERFILERVDAILLNPVDSWRIAPAIRAANKIGIPVITMDVNALGEEIEIASFIASDNFQAGQLCADYIVSKLTGRGKIAILGWAEMESCIKRQDGFKAYLGRYPQIEVVAEIDTQGDMNLIEKAMTEILRKTPDLEAVFGVNDPIALRAWKVVKEAEREREVFTVGVDANPESIEAIRSQQGYDLTIAQFPRAIGRRAIETVFDIVAGREVEKEQLLKVMPITINNLDSYQGWDAEMPLRIEKPW